MDASGSTSGAQEGPVIRRPHLHSHRTPMTLITTQPSYQAVHLADPIDERVRDPRQNA